MGCRRARATGRSGLAKLPLPQTFRPTLTPCRQVLEVPEFRNVTLKCLSEIAGLNVGPEYDAKFVVLFNMVMTAVNRMVPPSTSEWARCTWCGQG
jgi:exportin-1